MEYAHQRLGEILSGPGFYGIEPSWYERLGAWWRAVAERALQILTDFLLQLDGSTAASWLWPVALVVLFAAVAFSLNIVRRSWTGEGRQRRRIAYLEAHDKENPNVLLARADAAAAQGEYKEAVRTLYQACLTGLAARGVLKLQPHATNWVYLQQAKNLPDGQVAAFRQLTGLFERTWYGGQPAGQGEYETGWTLVRALIQ